MKGSAREMLRKIKIQNSVDWKSKKKVRGKVESHRWRCVRSEKKGQKSLSIFPSIFTFSQASSLCAFQPHRKWVSEENVKTKLSVAQKRKFSIKTFLRCVQPRGHHDELRLDLIPRKTSCKFFAHILGVDTHSFHSFGSQFGFFSGKDFFHNFIAIFWRKTSTGTEN